MSAGGHDNNIPADHSSATSHSRFGRFMSHLLPAPRHNNNGPDLPNNCNTGVGTRSEIFHTAMPTTFTPATSASSGATSSSGASHSGGVSGQQQQDQLLPQHAHARLRDVTSRIPSARMILEQQQQQQDQQQQHVSLQHLSQPQYATYTLQADQEVPTFSLGIANERDATASFSSSPARRIPGFRRRKDKNDNKSKRSKLRKAQSHGLFHFNKSKQSPQTPEQSPSPHQAAAAEAFDLQGQFHPRAASDPGAFNDKGPIPLPHRPKAKRSSSQVSFCTEPPDVLETICRAELEPEERSCVWYDAKDVIKFKDTIRISSAKIRMSAKQRAQDDHVAGQDAKSWQLLNEYRAKTARDLKRADVDRMGTEAAAEAALDNIRAQLDGVNGCVSATVTDYSNGQSNEEEVRGLEHRTSFERQRNKVLAMKSVLGLHRKLKARRRASADGPISPGAAAAAKANETWKAGMAASNASGVARGNDGHYPILKKAHGMNICLSTGDEVLNSAGPNASANQDTGTIPNTSSSSRYVAIDPSTFRTCQLNDAAQKPQDEAADNEAATNEAQELAAFTTKVNRYAALIAARTAEQDFREAYPDIVSARRRMSDQVLSMAKQRLPMTGISSDEISCNDDSDDDSEISMNEEDLAAIKLFAKKTGGRSSSGQSIDRRAGLGKRKSCSDLHHTTEKEHSSAESRFGASMSVIPPFQSGSRDKRSSEVSIKADGQQLELAEGQSRKRRSITGPLVEGLEQFILDEREKDDY